MTSIDPDVANIEPGDIATLRDKWGGTYTGPVRKESGSLWCGFIMVRCSDGSRSSAVEIVSVERPAPAWVNDLTVIIAKDEDGSLYVRDGSDWLLINTFSHWSDEELLELGGKPYARPYTDDGAS